MRSIFGMLAGLARLDAALDRAVFGKELGIFGEKATDEELDAIVGRLSAGLRNVLGVNEEVEEEVEEEVDVDELAEENVDIDDTPRSAFVKGYEMGRDREEVDVDDIAEENVDIDDTPKAAFVKGYEIGKEAR